MKTTGLTATVMEQLTKRIGKTVYLTDLMDWTGYTATQIQTAIIRTQHKGLESITTVTKGQAWRYNGPADSVAHNVAEKRPEPVRKIDVNSAYGHAHAHVSGYYKEEWRTLGIADNGDAILQDTNGALWRATKL